MTEHRLSAQTWILLIALGAIWGASFLFARIAVLEIPPLTLVFARVAIAAMALNIFIFFNTNDYRPSHSMWMNFAIMGVLNNIIPFGLIFYGQTEIGAGLAAVVNAMTPIWTIIIANFTTNDERFSKNKAIGIILGFIGVAILIGSSALTGLSASVWGQIAVLGATISYGCAGVFGRRFKDVPPMQTARGQLTMSSAIILPFALFLDQPWSLTVPSFWAIASVLALALICTAYAYILFFRILSTAGATNVSLVTFLVPPSAILLGIIVLGETLEMRQIIGTTIIMVGLIVIDGRLLRLGTNN